MKSYNIIISIVITFYFLSCSGVPTSWYEGYKTEVTINETNTNEIQDSFLNVNVGKTIKFSINNTLLNLSDSTLFVDFDYCTFVDNKNYTYQIISGSTKLSKLEDAQRIIILPPKSKYYAEMYPREKTSWKNNRFYILAVFDEAKIGDICKISIAYRINDKTAPVKYLLINLRITKSTNFIYETEYN